MSTPGEDRHERDVARLLEVNGVPSTQISNPTPTVPPAPRRGGGFGSVRRRGTNTPSTSTTTRYNTCSNLFSTVHLPFPPLSSLPLRGADASRRGGFGRSVGVKMRDALLDTSSGSEMSHSSEAGRPNTSTSIVHDFDEDMFAPPPRQHSSFGSREGREFGFRPPASTPVTTSSASNGTNLGTDDSLPSSDSVMVIEGSFDELFALSSAMKKNNEKRETDIIVSCPICMEKYSAIRYPVVSPNCGHSLCTLCAPLQKHSNCVTCGKNIKAKTGGNDLKKNFALLDVITVVQAKDEQLIRDKEMIEKLEQQNKKHQADLVEMVEKQEKEARNEMDNMECVKCETKEKRERMKICVTCAQKWNKEWKGMKEEEIRAFIICAFCSIGTAHSGHTLANYLPWKLNEVLTTTVTNHQSTVSGMDELSHYEMERGKECVEIWKKEMDSWRVPGTMECETYRAGLVIVDVLNKECELVTRASEDCLPPLRKYSKIVKDSTARIQQLKTDVKEKEDLSGWKEGEKKD